MGFLPLAPLNVSLRFVNAPAASLDATRHLAIARQEPLRKSQVIGIYMHVLGSYALIP